MNSFNFFMLGFYFFLSLSTERIIAIPVIENLNPNYGPIAGGTTVTLLGKEFGSGNSTPIVYFGEKNAAETVTVNSTTIIVQSPSTNETGSLEIIIDFNGLTATTNQSFVYLENPEINGFTISSGGSVLTVIGRNLDSVANPQLDTTVVITQLGLPDPTYSYYENCIFTFDDLYCPLPILNLPLAGVSNIQFDLENDLSSTTVTPGDVATIYGSNNTVVHIGLGFVFDGYEKYANITDPKAGLNNTVTRINLGFVFDGYEKYANITYAEDGLQGHVPTFNFITPLIINGSDNVICNEPEPLLIPGENLFQSCVDGGVVCQVWIGIEECMNLTVNETDLICYPPKKKPQPSGDETFCVSHPNTLTVKISVGLTQYDYRCLDYCNDLNIPLIVGLSAGLGGALLVFIIVLLIILLCRRQRRKK